MVFGSGITNDVNLQITRMLKLWMVQSKTPVKILRYRVIISNEPESFKKIFESGVVRIYRLR